MPRKPTTREMSDAQEEHIAQVFGVRKTRASGSHWRDQMDDRGHRMEEAVAFAFDGKSTFGKSTSINRSDLAKAVEQSYGERPCMAYRFYDDWTLDNFEDWYLLREDDLLELIERSRLLSEVERIIRAAQGSAQHSDAYYAIEEALRG